jgi:uncharacterized protein (DUF2141 family)
MQMLGAQAEHRATTMANRPLTPMPDEPVPDLKWLRWLAMVMVCALAFGQFGYGKAYAAEETATSCAATNAPAAGPRLYITATGARSVAGNITFTLYGADPARFLAHKGKLALMHVPLSSTEAVGCFVVSAPGVYAVAIYHDENNDHHFGRTLIGMPAEGYGFSNNARIFLAPPSFRSVQFRVGPGETRIAIKLRY